jgi:hypothetical protein
MEPVLQIRNFKATVICALLKFFVDSVKECIFTIHSIDLYHIIVPYSNKMGGLCCQFVIQGCCLHTMCSSRIIHLLLQEKRMTVVKVLFYFSCIGPIYVTS